MAQPRLYCAALSPGIVTLDEHESRHALGSLRLRPGDEVSLFDGRGRVAHGVLRAHDQAREDARRHRTATRPACFDVQRVLCEPPPSRSLTIIVAGCKGPRLTWMVEKLTEIGVTGLTVANFDRSVVRTGPAHADKLRRTALEAAKQSRRAWLPSISCGLSLGEALQSISDATLLAAHPVDDATPLGPYLLSQERSHEQLAAVVGPEGGLTEAETTLLGQQSATFVRLSPNILRVETAAISIAANWAAH